MRCRIVIQEGMTKIRKPFKFVNAVADFMEFLPLVQEFWSSMDPLFNSTSAMHRFSKKLKLLKPLLRKLKNKHIGEIEKRTKEAWEILCDRKNTTMLNPTQENMRQESRAYDRWNILSTLEEKILSQKAKVHWLDIGDGNNKQFHHAAKVREVRNVIREIQREDGTTTRTQEEIKVEAVDHFPRFLSHTPDDFVGVTEAELKLLLIGV